MQALTLSPEVLTWAADQVGHSLNSLAKVVVKRERDRVRLMEGKLTAPQAEKLAKLTGVPFGLLFLKEPPQIQRPSIPDLRQTVNPTPLSRDFREQFEDVLRKQEWYVDKLRELGARPLPLVGRFAMRLNADAIAADIKTELGLSGDLRRIATTTDAYFSRIAEKAEAVGVLVMKSGIVKSNVYRPLSVAEFRGFAIADPYAPLVFINGRDAQVASVFTLVHELAHIWIGESGVSDLGGTTFKGIEQTCNRVAAEVLVPKGEFTAAWRRDPTISILAKRFRVSTLVIARRALDFGWIDQDAYAAVAKGSAAVRGNDSSGGDAYVTIPVRNSKRFTKALVRSALTGETLLRDAASMLGVKPDTVMELGRRGENLE